MKLATAAAGGLLLLGASAFSLLSGPEPLQAPDIPAFPGAEGCGAVTLQPSRLLPLRVHQVTNTNDSGTGSLRAAWEAVNRDFYDIIIFRVSGRIHLLSPLTISGGSFPYTNPTFQHVYLAGQTAPGRITITSREFGAHANSDHVLMRYIDYRKYDRLQLKGKTVYADHLSLAWSSTGGSGGANAINVGTITNNNDPSSNALSFATIANTLHAEPSGWHPTTANPNGLCVSMFRNAWQDGFRKPWAQTTPPSGGQEFINNLVHNWSGGASQGRSSATLHAINIDFQYNYHTPGPATDLNLGSEAWPFYLLTQCFEVGGCTPEDIQINVEGNLNHVNNYTPTFGLDAWNEIRCGRDPQGDLTPECSGGPGAPVPTDYRRPESLTLGGAWAYTRVPMTETLRSEILEDVGNNSRLACDGTWIPRRDVLDSTFVAQMINGTGPSSIANIPATGPTTVTDPDEAPLVPVPDPGTPCTDTSGDGIPDAWYERWGFSPTNPPPVDSVTESNYLLIEHYLNNSNPFDPTPWAEAAPTFNNRWFYLMGGSELIEVPSGTGTVLIPDTTVIPRGFARKLVYNHPTLPAADSALIMTCEAYGVPVDSASVDAVVSIWQPPGIPDAAYLRNTPFPGSPC